jgi:hypothetical protein
VKSGARSPGPSASNLGSVIVHLVARSVPHELEVEALARHADRDPPDTEAAATRQLPAIYEWGEIARAGGLIAYGPLLAEIDRRVAAYIDKILKGANPADLSVEQPTKFELVINMKTARVLGLTIPQSILVRTDEVIP